MMKLVDQCIIALTKRIDSCGRKLNYYENSLRPQKKTKNVKLETKKKKNNIIYKTGFS